LFAGVTLHGSLVDRVWPTFQPATVALPASSETK
jgi:hypothetical protein